MRRLALMLGGVLLAVLLGTTLPAHAITATTTGAKTTTVNATMKATSHDTACDGRGSVAKWTRQGSGSIYSFKNNHGCNTELTYGTGGTYFVSAQACTDNPLTLERCGNWER